MSKFAKIPLDTFQTLQMNAGFLTTDFNPVTGAYNPDYILGATSGGINFTDTPTFTDFAEDIDNAPKKMKEFMHIDDREVKYSGTFVAMRASTAAKLIPGATVSGNKITPKKDISSGDFIPSIWLVGDYSDKTGALNGGFMAIKMYNALSTGGFSLQTSDKAKGQFAFTFDGHYSIEAQDTVPYEVYVQEGTAEPTAFSITAEAVESDEDSTKITPSKAAGSGNVYLVSAGTHVRLPNAGEEVNGDGWSAFADVTGLVPAANGWEVVVAIVNDNTHICIEAAKTLAVVWEDNT